LVAWQNPLEHNHHSFIVKDHPSGTVLQRRMYAWLNLPALPDLIPIEEYPMFEITDPRWTSVFISSTGDSTNVRPEPNTNKPAVTTIGKGRPARLLLDEQTIKPDGTWLPIRLDTDPNKSFDTADWAIFGWVREDVVTYEVYTSPVPDPEPEPEPDPIPEPIPEPDPVPEPVKYFYIPLPEAGMSQARANAIALILEWVVKVMLLYPLADAPERTAAGEFIAWLAVIIRNWNETLANYEGIAIVPVDDSGEEAVSA